MVLIYLTHQTNVRDSSAEGAVLNSHGRKAVVKRHLRGPRPEGPALGSKDIEMPHLRRSEPIPLVQPTALRPGLFNAAPSALFVSLPTRYHRESHILHFAPSVL